MLSSSQHSDTATTAWHTTMIDNDEGIYLLRRNGTMATPGHQFFDEHMAYIYAGNIDGMIDNQYSEDAVLISPFDLLDTPPPHIIRGRAALKAFFHKYVGWQGAINVESLYDFAETEDAISFQAVFTSNTGKWVVGDAWYMKEKQIAYHFSFAHKIG